jgi:hypothetical protein
VGKAVGYSRQVVQGLDMYIKDNYFPICPTKSRVEFKNTNETVHRNTRYQCRYKSRRDGESMTKHLGECVKRRSLTSGDLSKYVDTHTRLF